MNKSIPSVETRKNKRPKTTSNEIGTRKKPKKDLDLEQEDAETEENVKNLYSWWEDEDNNPSIEWATLEHNGVLFPPEYEPLPDDVTVIYEGNPVSLPIKAEEVATFYGRMLDSPHAKMPNFQKNFFYDFQTILRDTGQPAIDRTTGDPVLITQFDKCDFSSIFNHYEALRQAELEIPSEEKQRIRQEQLEKAKKYKKCIINGHEELVSGFLVKPPGLFRGKGDHPKAGKVKERITPEMITLNISKDAAIPEAPPGHHWKEIKHDSTGLWIAMWTEPVSRQCIKVTLHKYSRARGNLDFRKFEKARQVKHHIETIRRDYQKGLKNPYMKIRQLATATYLIDKLAIGIGVDRYSDEPSTGCCTLRYEHVSLTRPSTVTFDFLDKNSSPYRYTHEVDPQVFKNLRILKKSPKGPGDQLFNLLDSTILSNHLRSYIPGLTATSIRIFNASFAMQQELDSILDEGTVAEKVLKFTEAKRRVPMLFNHRNVLSKCNGEIVARIENKILELKWKRYRIKREMLARDLLLKKEDRKYFKDMKELSTETMLQVIERIEEREKKAANKRYENKMKSAKEELDSQKLNEKEIKWLQKLGAIREKAEKFRKELKSKSSQELEPDLTMAQMRDMVQQLDEQINCEILRKKEKESSCIAMDANKQNYIDPRLTVMFSKKYNVPIERLMNKTTREGLQWAIETTDANWRY